MMWAGSWLRRKETTGSRHCRVATATAEVRVDDGDIGPGPKQSFGWNGAVPPQKWMNFYTKVLSRFAASPGLKLEVSFRVAPGER